MDRARMPADWPFRAEARAVRAGGQEVCLFDIDRAPEAAPILLLLHGAGGSAHSFRALAPRLAGRFRLLIPDLPGQGFSRAGRRDRLGLAPMAEDLWQVCDRIDAAPHAIIGHSAGAALALQMARLRPVAGVAGINAALGNFDGAAGVMFPLLARALAAAPLVPQVVARLWGNARTVDRLLASTGSPLDPEGRRLYLALVRDPAHVGGTLGMMAQWRLDGLMAALPSLDLPCLLIASDADRAVPASVSAEAVSRLRRGELVVLPGHGHLVHEEAPAPVAAALIDWLGRLA